MSSESERTNRAVVDEEAWTQWSSQRQLGGLEVGISHESLARARAVGQGVQISTTHRYSTIDLAAQDSGDGPVLHLFQPAHDSEPPGPAVVFIHGGGFVAGTWRDGLQPYLTLAERLKATVISVEYRLAPERPFPAAHDDCWMALLETIHRAGPLGIDPRTITVAGQSAGGGLALGVALRARDDGVKIHALALHEPMLDPGNDGSSLAPLHTWDAASNRFAWNAFLGDLAAAPELSRYAAAALQLDLHDLPTTYIDVGTADLFYAECDRLARMLVHVGTRVEFHAWPGAFHGFDSLAPLSRLSREAQECRDRWFARTLRP